MVSFDQRDRGRRTGQRARRMRFERLVQDALRGLPPDIRAQLDNVDIVIADEPTPAQRADLEEDDTLFGLYEGIPLTERAQYTLALPDKITIFRGPLERACSSPEEIAHEVQITVLHELAHHLGFDEDRIADMGLG